ncbi:hypothetical protein HYS31_02060 [Candidatus Woesearchaeota archaeon]|nr:hypothetical protein [Candidatus Woesearchaeota archaeon]
MKLIRQYIRKGLKILSNPEKEFSSLGKTSLEECVGYYMLMLAAVAVAAGLANLVLSVIKTIYLDIALSLDVNYLRMINYSMGVSTSIIFLYIFIGTFGVFAVSAIAKPFFPKIKFADFLKITLCSLSPFLLFGWVPYGQFSLLVWSLFLFVIGIRSYRHEHVKRTSIGQRY